MDKQKTVPIQLDISPENLETLTSDLKRLGEGLDKACNKGIYGLKESQLLCISLENYAQLISLIAQSISQTIDNANNLLKKEEIKEEKLEQQSN